MMVTEEWSTLVKGALDFLFPPLCAGCGDFNDSEEGICETCLAAIDTFDMPTCLTCGAAIVEHATCAVCKDRSFPVIAFGNYQPPLKDVIIQFKFKGNTSSVDLLVSLLYSQFQKELDHLKATCLLPIPLHLQRQNRRGYNQATIIAEKLASCMNLPIYPELLARVKKRKPQAKLDFKHRARNIKDVFAIGEESSTKQRIILVDDVVTTGATVMEARTVLEGAGHRVVAAVTLAHGV